MSEPMPGATAVDPRVARRLTDAEIKRADADAAAARQVRTEEARARLARAERAERRQERRADRAERATSDRTRRAERAGRRAARRRAAAKRLGGWVDYARTNAPAVYSTVVYGLAVAVAVGGQVSIATQRGLPVIAGVGMAGFVEGLALSMALTAHQLRMRGERALLPRVLTWVAAGFAAGLNFFAHRGEDLVLAVALGAASAVGIVVWEIRSGAKHREALRERGIIPQPATRFGPRRWVRYPRETARAWSLDVRDRVSPEANRLLRRAGEDRARRRLVRTARRAARRAARRGDTGPALAALMRLADAVGVPSPSVPAIESGRRRAVPAPTGVPSGDAVAGDTAGGDGPAVSGGTPRGDTGGSSTPGDAGTGVPRKSGATGTRPVGDGARRSGTGVVPLRRISATAGAGEASTADRMRAAVLEAWTRGEDPRPVDLDRQFGTNGYAKRLVRSLRAEHPDLAGQAAGRGHGD